jgi:hypothetical protein
VITLRVRSPKYTGIDYVTSHTVTHRRVDRRYS